MGATNSQHPWVDDDAATDAPRSGKRDRKGRNPPQWLRRQQRRERGEAPPRRGSKRAKEYQQNEEDVEDDPVVRDEDGIEDDEYANEFEELAAIREDSEERQEAMSHVDE